MARGTAWELRNALQAQVSYVRRMLEPLGPDVALERHADAYVLKLTDLAVLDVVVFERAIHAATERLTSGGAQERPDVVFALRGRAEPLARDPVYGTAMYDDFAQQEIARLKELHATGREQQATALLELGRTGEALELLQPLAAEYPLRESVWALLILAMYRSHRQADALRVYGTARARLVDELGVEPGVQLNDLERRVLRAGPVTALERTERLVGRWRRLSPRSPDQSLDRDTPPAH